MAKHPTPILLSNEERRQLERVVRAPTTQQRLVQRAQMVLAAADGDNNAVIGRRMGVRPATVSKWRLAFAARGIAGLEDGPRPGPPRRYDESTERRILAKLDEAPPAGYASWNGRLLADSLGDVPKHHVWRVMRERGIQLQRRRSWCVSTDPEFAAKAADIVGLYLNPPENAVVISVDEKPSIQALERAQGYLRLPNGSAVRGFSYEYKRHGTTTLFAALNILRGTVFGKHTNRRRRREFLAFMNELLALHPDQELHVILDNLNTHKPKRDRWLSAHPQVHFHYTPTHASWLNQVEVWFSILSRQALQGASFNSPKEVRQAIDQFIAAYNETAAPFEWTKTEVHRGYLKQQYAELTN